MDQQQTSVGRAAEQALRMRAIAAAFGRTLSVPEAAGVAVEQGIAELGAYAGAVILRTGESEYRLLTQTGCNLLRGEQPRVSLDAPRPIADAAQTGIPVWITSRDAYTQRYAQMAVESNPQTQALAALPLLIDGRSVGAISLSFAAAQSFNQRQRAMLETLALLCAQALERAKLGDTLEQQRRAVHDAVQARDEFLSLAAHELKTPLTSLYGYAQLLRSSAEQDPDFSDRDRRAIAMIVKQAERFNLLVDALLDVSRIDSGNLELDRARLAIVEVLRLAAGEIQIVLSRHSLCFDEVDAGLQIDGDVNRLVQAFQNLLLNAIKFSPKGGEIVVRISREGNRARIDVVDHGIGIPNEALPRLFDRLFRAGNVDGLRISGLGIGLYIVSAIVALHGGTLEVQSQEGRGSVFSVFLPLSQEVGDRG